MAETFQVVDGYDRRKTPAKVTVRYLTLEEIKALSYGDHVAFVARDGKLRRAKVNGNPKTWKRDPSRVEVSLKYGMYEYATLSTADALSTLVMVLSF